MSNLIGQSLGRYHILEQLGEGGMATVYKAYDTHLETDVAVKVIRTDTLAPSVLDRALKRFEREAKALARLTHANIVKVSDYGKYQNRTYLVMPFLPGGNLKQLLHDRGRLPWPEAVRLVLPLTRALEYAHSQNVIHRDVKPSNILITASGDPMLTDFGVAKVIEQEATLDLTGTAAAVGTPEYMAPEQTTSKSVDHRVDIYALGIVFYEIVTGRKPYTADTPLAVLIKQASEPLPRPRQYVPGLPEKVEQILFKALAKKPQDRYQSMGEFATALERLSGGTTGAGEKLVAYVQKSIPASARRILESAAQPEAPIVDSDLKRTLVPEASLNQPKQPDPQKNNVAGGIILDSNKSYAPGWKWPQLGTVFKRHDSGESLLRTFEGHTNGVYSVSFSPDGQTLASGSYDKTIRLWQVNDGALLRIIKGHTDGVYSVSFSPDGQTLASGSFDKTIRLWLVNDGSVLRIIKKHTDGVYSVSFSPDGQALASGSHDKTINLWRISDGTLLHTLEDNMDGVYSTLFSPDGQTLASGSFDKTIRLWRVSDGTLLRKLEGHSGFVYGISLSPDGQTLASGSIDTTVKLWRSIDGALLKTLRGHTDGVLSVAFSLDGTILASGSTDATIKLWRASDGTLLNTLQASKKGILSIAFSKDGRLLASGSLDGMVRLWGVP
jgi:WD40 repeat protein/tRNA A-37 threonylcarbamoyl transferase component Bud32